MDFLSLEFVNSSWFITHKLFSDPLRDNEWLIKLSDKWMNVSLPTPTETDLVRLIEMRGLFMKLFVKLAEGTELINTDIELINRYMFDISFYRQLQVQSEHIQLQDIPHTRNWSWFMSEIAASFSRLYSSETANSIKICQNPECSWFFIDESKGGNRKWCDDTCASLMKVRRFRQKQRKSAE